MVPGALFTGSASLAAQCPATGETKVFKSSEGTGYYFYKFIGDSSFMYYLEGKTFSMNDKDDPGRTFFFIDGLAYESTLSSRAELAKYVQSTKDVDILRAQAKQQQEDFKKAAPGMVITDFGSSATDVGRNFYLWKKDSPPGDKAATQYLVSTLVKDGVVVLSILLSKPVSQDAVFGLIQEYTRHFDVVSSDRCAKVLAVPITP